MILPIVGYGDPVLRKVGQDITPEYPNLKETIANMYETMYNAYGVGLAAPQVGLPIRLFVIDTTPFSCLLYTSPSPRDRTRSRMPSSA